MKSQPCEKGIYRTQSRHTDKGYVDLISGAINLSNIEADLYGIIKNRNEFTNDIPGKFEHAIRKQKNNYDFILIDTYYDPQKLDNIL